MNEIDEFQSFHYCICTYNLYNSCTLNIFLFFIIREEENKTTTTIIKMNNIWYAINKY